MPAVQKTLNHFLPVSSGANFKISSKIFNEDFANLKLSEVYNMLDDSFNTSINFSVKERPNIKHLVIKDVPVEHKYSFTKHSNLEYYANIDLKFNKDGDLLQMLVKPADEDSPAIYTLHRTKKGIESLKKHGMKNPLADMIIRICKDVKGKITHKSIDTPKGTQSMNYQNGKTGSFNLF